MATQRSVVAHAQLSSARQAPTAVIPLGIDTDAFRPIHSRQDARRQLQLPADAAVVLWTGRLELHCNPPWGHIQSSRSSL